MVTNNVCVNIKNADEFHKGQISATFTGEQRGRNNYTCGFPSVGFFWNISNSQDCS